MENFVWNVSRPVTLRRNRHRFGVIRGNVIVSYGLLYKIENISEKVRVTEKGRMKFFVEDFTGYDLRPARFSGNCYRFGDIEGNAFVTMVVIA